jgi:trigger factor
LETEIKELEHQIELKVTLPTEQVDAAIQKTLRRLSERVNIAGFRRGKAPLGMVRTHVGEERLREDALELLVDESLEEAYHQREIQPLFAPELDIEQFEQGKALIYKVVIDPWPKLDLPDVTEVDVRVDPIRVGDEDTEKALERLRESYAEYSPKEGSAGTGDAVALHWRLSGKDPWRTDMIELGKEALVPGFDEKVQGIQAGEEREFVLPVQEQELTFFVQAMEIKRKHLPDIDDSLAGKLGADTLGGLKEKIRTELLAESQRRHDQKLRDEILHHYLERIPVTFSAHAEQRALDSYVESFQERSAKSGRTLENFLRDLNLTEEDWREKVARPQAVQLLKEQIVLDLFADRKQIAADENETAQIQREGKSSSDRRQAYNALRRTKALDLLIEEWNNGHQPINEQEEN